MQDSESAKIKVNNAVTTFTNVCNTYIETVNKFDSILHHINILEWQGFAISKSKNDICIQRQEFLDILNSGLVQIQQLSSLLDQKSSTIK